MSNENSFNFFREASAFSESPARIKCVGVGGCGGNTINSMVASANLDNVDFIAVNTDVQDLNKNKAPQLVQIGEKLLHGLGVGGDPNLGKQAAQESILELEYIVEDTDLLFITAGMGGGTGTGVAPEIARIAKEKYGDNILVIGVVTRPFDYEGFDKKEKSDKGIIELQKYADCVLIVPNQKIFEIYAKERPNMSVSDAFAEAVAVLQKAIKGITDVILKPSDMNIDFNDLKRVMLKSGKAFVGVGEASGKKRHIEAFQKAIKSPLLENQNISGAKGFIVSFTSKEELSIAEMQEVLEFVKKYNTNNKSVKISKGHDKTLADGVLQVVIIAGAFPDNRGVPYFGRNEMLYENNIGGSKTNLPRFRIPAIYRDRNKEEK